MCSLKFRTLALRNQHMQAHYKSTVKKSVPVASNIDSTLSQNDQQSSLILENIVSKFRKYPTRKKQHLYYSLWKTKLKLKRKAY